MNTYRLSADTLFRMEAMSCCWMRLLLRSKWSILAFWSPGTEDRRLWLSRRSLRCLYPMLSILSILHPVAIS